jgi:hypothetical protein
MSNGAIYLVQLIGTPLHPIPRVSLVSSCLTYVNDSFFAASSPLLVSLGTFGIFVMQGTIYILCRSAYHAILMFNDGTQGGSLIQQ